MYALVGVVFADVLLIHDVTCLDCVIHDEVCLVVHDVDCVI